MCIKFLKQETLKKWPSSLIVQISFCFVCTPKLDFQKRSGNHDAVAAASQVCKDLNSLSFPGMEKLFLMFSVAITLITVTSFLFQALIVPNMGRCSK